MLRTGEIIELDRLSGEGKILDSNEQEVSFDLHDLPETLYVGSKVSFEIVLGPKGLTAIMVCRMLVHGVFLSFML